MTLSPRILKSHFDADLFTLELGTLREHCLTLRCGERKRFFEELGKGIRSMDAVVLGQFVFAGCAHYPSALREMGMPGHPITWVQGDPCQSGAVYSSQVTAVGGVETRSLLLDGKVVGTLFEDEDARYCRLSGMLPATLEPGRGEQTLSLLERMAAALESADMRFTDTIRTWFYLDRLLDWYDEFNEVRTAFFQQEGVFEKLVPASTGIGATNPWGAAIVGDLLAVVPKSERCTICSHPSPLQCPAPSYRSSFSRAIEVAFSSYRRLLISGTASIAPDGSSTNHGDPVAQIELTMRVVGALLDSCGMSPGDLCRGIAYFKNIADFAAWEEWRAESKFPSFPLAIAHADVCRDELLFEIELDAIQIVPLCSSGSLVNPAIP